ncbi:uncharacterized protein LOC114754857 [Neltuma alba]|uniref:uncharacterized protein LOC114754857 n=1 Tax=Neltuma alba TaxID=207710 RepID=UPI0010A2D9C7|nr:uncharacterized protein LOC114754857 [Prosopis alba]
MIQLWLLAGDFNDIKCEEEQRGGRLPNQAKLKRFRDNIEDCRLVDLNSKGPKFTWRGPVVNFADRLYKKLGCGLCNSERKNRFLEAFMKVGPKIQSDHHPLILLLKGPEGRKINRPFKFEAMWLKHKDFKRVLKDNWQRNDEVWNDLEELEPKLKIWNQEVFGNIKKQKKEILNRIAGIQKSLQRSQNPFLEDLESDLREELREVLE